MWNLPTGGIISFNGSTRQKRVIERKNEKGETPLHQACLTGNVEKVKNLIKTVSSSTKIKLVLLYFKLFKFQFTEFFRVYKWDNNHFNKTCYNIVEYWCSELFALSVL